MTYTTSWLGTCRQQMLVFAVRGEQIQDISHNRNIHLEMEKTACNQCNNDFIYLHYAATEILYEIIKF